MTIIHKVNYWDADNLNLCTKMAYNVGNFFFTPVRYLRDGYNVKCVQVPVHRNNQQEMVNHFLSCESTNHNLIKTILAVIAFIPGMLVGYTIKGSVILCSKQMRDNERDLIEFAFSEDYDQLAGEIRIGIYLEDEEIIAQIFRKIRGDSFAEYYTNLGVDGAAYREDGRLFVLKVENEILTTEIMEFEPTRENDI